MADPLFLYHATYRAHLPGILRWGLGGSPHPITPNYEDSRPGVVYLARCQEVARSYAECSDLVPEPWLAEVVVLQVDVRRLEAHQLGPDPNVLREPDECAETLAYQGTVPVEAICVLGDAPGG